MLLLFAAILVLIACGAAAAETAPVTAAAGIYEQLWFDQCDAEPEHESFTLPDGNTLVSFRCYSAAYNDIDVWFIHDAADGGVRPVFFAQPVLHLEYDTEAAEPTVNSMEHAGFTATGQLVNSWYDADTGEIGEHSKWRGLGDASSTGSWQYRDGGFMLVWYAVDATYDGEMNPETLVNHR